MDIEIMNSGKKYLIIGSSDNVTYGYIKDGVFYEYAFGVELPICIDGDKIYQSVREDDGPTEKRLYATINGMTITNTAGALFYLKDEAP